MKSWLKKSVVCCALIAVALTSATPAHALLRSRVNHVLVAGSYVEGSSECTLGVILTKNGFWNNVSPYRRAMRYAVTAAHCTVMGQTIDGENHSPIGKTIDLDEEHDTALIELYPLSSMGCSWITPGGSGSGGAHCVPTSIYRPRALGRVFMSPGGAEQQIPMTGPASPQDGSQICTSGIVTGINCSFSAVPLPPIWVDHFRGRRAGYTDGRNVEPGDSGSPVVDSHGVFFGIQTGKGAPGSTTRNLIVWTPAEFVFRKYSDYSLAPSN